MLQRGANNQQGYGRVNMDAATSDDLVLIDDKDGVAQGRGAQYELKAGYRKFTLVYTDAPGSPSASKSLVDNLDLKVELTDGTVLRSSSQVNNSEQIVLDEDKAASGPVKVTVEGTSIPQSRNGALPFALVVSR